MMDVASNRASMELQILSWFVVRNNENGLESNEAPSFATNWRR